MKKLLLSIATISCFLTANAQNPNFEWAIYNPAQETGFREHGVRSDNNGNIYITGPFSGTKDFDPGIGVFNLTSQGASDIFIQKLDPNGNFIWAKRIGNNIVPSEEPSQLAVDGSGNCYITGKYRGTMDFDPGIGIFNLMAHPTSTITDAAFVLKVDTNGDFQWAKSVNTYSTSSTIGRAYGERISLDQTGNVYFFGGFNGVMDANPNAGTSYIGQGSSYNEDFMIKLDASGNFIYGKANVPIPGNNNNAGFADQKTMVVDASNNLYVLGDFLGTVSFSGTSFTATTTTVYFQKFDTNGNQLWIKTMENAETKDIIKDINGNMYVIGFYNSTGNIDFDFGTATFNLSGSTDQFFILKLDPSANFLWVKLLDVNQGISEAVIDNGNDLIMIGNFAGTPDFDLGTGTVNMTSNGGIDFYVRELDANGNLIWVKGFGGTGDDYTANMCIDNQNNVISIGTFEATVDFDPTSNVFSLTAPNSDSYFVQKLSQSSPTGLNEVSTNNLISIYPNPSSNQWNVILSNTDVNYQSLQLTDVTGKVVWNFEIDENKTSAIVIPNTNLANGLYFLKTVSKQGVEIQKLMKE